MKNFLTYALVLFLGSSLYAGTKNIHLWQVSPSSVWRTGIILTNACNQDNVDATVKLWTGDGNILVSKQISSEHATDSEGRIKVSLKPHQTKIITFSFGYFPIYTYGSGIVTSKTNSGVKCLTGSYTYSTTKSGAPNPYGQGIGYRFNNGENF